MHRSRAVVTALLGAVLALAVWPSAAQASNDPMFNRQYGVRQITAVDAWTKTRGAGVIIAVVDSGVDVQHPDLAGKLVAGHDFADNDSNPDDDSPLKDGNNVFIKGHGTHVAGLAAAITDNGVGVAGVAPDAKIMPLKVFPSNPNRSTLLALNAISTAIRYAVDNGAKVINLSVGTFKGLSLVGSIESPCADAYRRGSLCVVAAGNDGEDKPSGYARDVQFLNVTANDANGKHAGFGQWADTQWAVSAPGVDNWSTVPVEDGSYGSKQGTSMAAPHAAGVAALLFAQGLTVDKVVERILSTATPMGNPGVNGAGRIAAGPATGAIVTSARTTVPPAVRRTATTRAALPSSTDRDDFIASATTVTLETDTTRRGDDFAFAAGPENNTKLQPATQRKPVKEVSAGAMAITLAALAVVGVAWGALSATRRRLAKD